MACALIQTNPPKIIQTWPSDPVAFINVPGKWQAYNVRIGWTSDDGAYALIAVTPFIIPRDQINVGEPSYAIDAQGNVSENYQTQPLPLPLSPSPPSPITIIDGKTFLTRVTDDEYQAVIVAAAKNVQIARWIEDLRLSDTIDVTSVEAQAAKAGLVAAGLLTNDRADVIFATA